MSRSEARPWSHPQRTIWWTDDKLNPEEHYTIQPGNLNHIRSVPGFQEFKPRAWKIFVLMPGWSPTPSSYWTDSVKDSLLPRLLSWKKIQVCVVLCFTSETFEALRSLSPLPPFPPFTASRASFLLLKQKCDCEFSYERFSQMCCTHLRAQSSSVSAASYLPCLRYSAPRFFSVVVTVGESTFAAGTKWVTFQIWKRCLTITFMPAPIFTIWQVVLPILVLFSVFSNLPNGFVFLVNRTKLSFMSSCEHLYWEI